MNDGTVVNTFLVLMKLDPDKAGAMSVMLGMRCLSGVGAEGKRLAQPLWERCLQQET